jgi:hypothetical protein
MSGSPGWPAGALLAAALVIVLAGGIGGCNANDTGPVLVPGSWYGTFTDNDGVLAGSISFTAFPNGKVSLQIAGTTDGITPFAFNAAPKILLEGDNFTVQGSLGNQAVSGYGRVRVFVDSLKVLIPIDSLPDHKLMVGDNEYDFTVDGAALRELLHGVWAVSSPVPFTGNSGSFSVTPGEAPPDASVDAAPPDGPPVDAPGDATSD